MGILPEGLHTRRALYEPGYNTVALARARCVRRRYTSSEFDEKLVSRALPPDMRQQDVRDASLTFLKSVNVFPCSSFRCKPEVSRVYVSAGPGMRGDKR